MTNIVTDLITQTLLADSPEQLHLQIEQLQKENLRLQQDLMDATIEVEAVSDEFRRTQLEVEQAKRDVELAKEQAERANNVKSAFLASMSHELRTPLNAIINFAKFLRRQVPGPLNEEQLQLMTNIADSGQHLLNLINDVLDMSKIESGALKLYIEKDLDVRELVQHAIRYAQPLLGDKPVALEVHLPDEKLPITGDKRRLLQIFINVLSNACKFTETGSIRVTARTHREQMQIQVTDSGPGISKEDADHVFVAFKQTDSGLRQGGGTGLGMPITRNLVEAHHGRIWFESEVGTGTTFYIELPLWQPETPAMQPEPAKGTSSC